MSQIQVKNIIKLGEIEKFIEVEHLCPIFTKEYEKRNPFLYGITLKKEPPQYFKFINNYTSLLNDLLGVKITESFGLPAVQYKIAQATYNQKELYGLLYQKQEEKDDTSQTLEDFIFDEDFLLSDLHDTKDLSFIRMLEKEYNIYLLPKQLKILIIRDLVTNERNRKMQDIFIKKDAESIEISQIKNFETEWQLLLLKEREDCDDLDISEEEIQLNYQIKGLLSIAEKELDYIRKDDIFQESLNHYLEMDVMGLLEQVELETHLKITQKDYDYYSLYQETVKKKLKKGKFLS